MTTTADAAARHPHIRPAIRTDLLDVYHIERQCFEEPWPFESFERHLDAPAFLVSIRDGRAVGYVVGDLGNGFPGPVGHIKDIAVHPDHRGEGLARELLERSLRRLADRGGVRAVLEVRESNAGAIALYRAAGFEPQRLRANYYADGEAALIMARSLT